MIALASSSTTLRITNLNSLNERIKREELPVEQLSSVLRLLFRSHSYYIDRESRKAVRRCFHSLYESSLYSDSYIKRIIIGIKNESQKSGIAPSSAFVLLEWTTELFSWISPTIENSGDYVTDLLNAMVLQLNLCLGSAQAKESLKTQAVRITRRCLRTALRSHSCEKVIGAIVVGLTSKRPTSTGNNSVLLGILCGVCARIPQAKETLHHVKKDIYTFYVREILGSRTVVPNYIVCAFGDFFANFTTAEEFGSELLPFLERGLLRAPEILLNDIITPLLLSLPHSIDLSGPLQEKLLKQFLTNTKSTNPVIRNGAVKAFSAAVSRCRDATALDKILIEIINPLKSGKIPSADQRVLYAAMLEAMPTSVTLANSIPNALLPIAIKEPNEAAIAAIISAIIAHLSACFEDSSELEKTIMDCIYKGLEDKRPTVRRLWFLKFGEMIWAQAAAPTSKFLKFCNDLVDKFLSVFLEVMANPLPAVQSGLITAGYVSIAVCLGCFLQLNDENINSAIKKANIAKECLRTTPKPSFFINPKVYSKLSSDDDHRWATRALAATAGYVAYEEKHADSWASAFLYVISGSSVSPYYRREACKSLTEIYLKYPESIGKIILGGIWQWLRGLESGDKECPASLAKTGATHLKDVIYAITLSPQMASKGSGPHSSMDGAIIKNQLVNMTVVSHHELITGIQWIALCQHAGVDPGTLANEMAPRLVSEIRMYTGLSGRSPYIRNAALKSAATLAFVSPESITPLVVKLFQSDLDSKLLQGISAQDVGIWKTEPGTPFVDVISKPHTEKIEKSKDAHTLKWEAELRAHLAQKKGAEKKLTADEKVRLDEQLAKEVVIREKISEVELRLTRGVGIIQSLAEGAPTAVDMWLYQAVTSLLKCLEAGAGRIVGDKGYSAFLACAEHVSPRLGNLRQFIGIATMRALGVAEVPPENCEEPLGSLAMRLLYRIRFAGEQRPFDVASLFYIVPFVTLIVQRGGIGTTTVDDVDEQVLLALDFLSYHTETFASTLLPRSEILQTLVSAMQKYSAHYKSIKDVFHDMCRCISDSITMEEISVLIDGAISPEVNVRTATLQAINADIDLTDHDFSDKLWIACYDEVDENVELAQSIWETNALEVNGSSALEMIPYLGRQDKQIRGAAARALAAVVRIFPDMNGEVLEALINLYREKAKPLLPQYDEFGMTRKLDTKDPWEARSGVAMALKELSDIFDHTKLLEFSQFLIGEGALADRNSYVRDEMIDAATTIISEQGGSHVEELMGAFEETLETPDDGSDAHDKINEAVIILYGALGRHLRSGDERVLKVIDRLLATLSTPSETVQYAVAECLPPLIKASRDKASGYLQTMLGQLFTAKGYASRRGAAYGLAGIVKGYGISALKDFRIMTSLRVAIEDKKNTNSRQGTLFAFELFSSILGRVFEPYVIQILPMLLSSFGDPIIDVREACSDAAKVCFSSLSSYGVKVILPDLLEGLEDSAWRSKKGACETLGAFAYLAPHQLAISLPDIIPPLTTVLNDSHKEVRASANRSLKKFGEVISNPEIKEVTPILLKALSDPTKYTDDALDALMKISFVHYLDSPSLALVVRVLERGLGDRSVTKRKAAQIIGSLAHLTDRKDLMVHIHILVKGLKEAIVDPVPATRATASKSLGSLVEKLGEDSLPDIIPGLMSTLKSDTGAGDRLGSAQALSEVLSGLGTQRLEETLPTILQNASSSKPAVREGFMSLFIFLPACFGNSFSAYLSKIIPPILSGLADDVESIRDTSLRAGRLLVKNFATRAIDLLLPELERGLADGNHRIRLSSVELVGDLLFNLTGISGKTEQEEGEYNTEVGNSLLEVLGQEKRDKVLSALYICRCDTSGQVRLAAIGVWKALVASPRTLKELVPTLTQLIIRRLASSNVEQRAISGQALGELIRKAGEGVLSTLLPTLEEGLKTASDGDSKQGICIALKELVASTAPESLEDYESTLVSIVRTALVDSDDDVRDAAADAFDSLQKVIGKKAVDQVLPHLLHLLQSKEEADNALAALLTLLTEQTRSNVILPALIPTLLSPPITRFNARALASLARVAGTALNRRIPHIMNSLMDGIVASTDEDLRKDLNDSFNAVIISVDEYDGLNTMMSEMLKLAKHDDHLKRAAACGHFARFFEETDLEYSRYTQDCIRILLMLFDDQDKEVVKNAWDALNTLTKRLRKEEMETLVVSTRSVLRQVGVPGHNLSGFLLPKGINAILPIFLQGLMYGTPDQRTQSALAISDIIDRSSGDSLRPFVTQITGPLIRVVSERSVDVKAAILLTLNSLLQKIPTHLKPFLPQLQRTFAKSLADTSSEVLRTRAAKALGTLITLTPRIDPLISELVSGTRTSDPGVKDAMLKALYEVVKKAGGNMGDASKASILALIEDALDEDDDHNAIAGSRLLGVLVPLLAREDAIRCIKSRALNPAFTKVSVLGLNAILLESAEALQDPTFVDITPHIISQGISHKTPFVSDNCVLAAGKYLMSEKISKGFETVKGIFESLTQAIKTPASGSSDTKRLALVVIRTTGRQHPELIRPHLSILAPAVFSCVRDIVIPVKLSAEQAFISLFEVSSKGDAVFDKYISTIEGPQKRSMNDYFKRVGMKLAAAEKDRNDAGGADLGLNSDELEDMREIMSVGRVDLETDSWNGGES
ncbi:armadillo-type protein [Geopyxis carbonaria]|nr:armadillo-type protein [Geopyxis carbonaria]